MTNPMLIFDYDGVLMDSVREVAVTAYNMVQNTIATRLNQLPQTALDLFLRNRFHVQPIGDAPVLVLALLALRRGRVISVDQLIDSLWSEPPKTAKNSVQRFVADKAVRKTIVVPGRLVNIVV